jgi:hypothetical protein
MPAIFFALLTALAVAFQLALACGAPWGEFTLGGKYRGQLPGAVRIVPIVSALLLAGFALIVLARAGLAFGDLMAASRWSVWIVVAYCLVGCVANFFTPSRRERLLWFPIVVLMFASSTIVAMS